VIDCPCWRSGFALVGLGARSLGCSAGPAGDRSWCSLQGQQRAEPDQVVRGHREGEDPIDQRATSVPQLSEEPHRLAPALDRLLDLRRPARRTDGGRHDQPMAILQQHASQPRAAPENRRLSMSWGPPWHTSVICLPGPRPCSPGPCFTGRPPRRTWGGGPAVACAGSRSPDDDRSGHHRAVNGTVVLIDAGSGELDLVRASVAGLDRAARKAR
jgi:hypothetical protein